MSLRRGLSRPRAPCSSARTRPRRDPRTETPLEAFRTRQQGRWDGPDPSTLDPSLRKGAPKTRRTELRRHRGAFPRPVRADPTQKGTRLDLGAWGRDPEPQKVGVVPTLPETDRGGGWSSE